MADDPSPPDDPTTRLREALSGPEPKAPRGGRLLAVASAFVSTLALIAALGFGGAWLLLSPDTPLAAEWNPTRPLDLSRPETPLTAFKLRRALGSEARCRAALATAATFLPMDPREGEGGCGIDWRVRVSDLSGVGIAPVETACPTALRLASWRSQVVSDAEAILGAPVVRLQHQGSYNCRPIRGGSRLSSHAAAMAIDIRGVVLSDGRAVPLLGNWEGDGPEARFWRAARDGACRWFGSVLGPEFDANHADHLHLQATGRGTCR